MNETNFSDPRFSGIMSTGWIRDLESSDSRIHKEKTIEKTVQMMENFNTPNEAIAAAVDQIESQNQWSIGNILKGLAGYIVFFSVIGLIVIILTPFKNLLTIEEFLNLRYIDYFSFDNEKFNELYKRI